MILPNIWKNKNVPNHQPDKLSIHRPIKICRLELILPNSSDVTTPPAFVGAEPVKYRVAFSDDLQCPWEERNEEGTENDLWIMGVIQGAFRKSWHHGYHWVVMSLPGRPPLEHNSAQLV
jgi:hypothetical protein